MIVVEDRIKNVMSKVFGVPVEAIGRSASNETIERWDSLGHMNLCLALEDEFSVELDGERVASMTDFGDVLEAVVTALGK